MYRLHIYVIFQKV